MQGGRKPSTNTLIIHILEVLPLHAYLPFSSTVCRKALATSTRTLATGSADSAIRLGSKCWANWPMGMQSSSTTACSRDKRDDEQQQQQQCFYHHIQNSATLKITTDSSTVQSVQSLAALEDVVSMWKYFLHCLTSIQSLHTQIKES